MSEYYDYLAFRLEKIEIQIEAQNDVGCHFSASLF